MNWIDVIVALVIYDFFKYIFCGLIDGFAWILSAIDKKLEEKEKGRLMTLCFTFWHLFRARLQFLLVCIYGKLSGVVSEEIYSQG